MTLDQMTLASSAIPMYFYPYTVRGNFYISGDNIASQPALFALQHAIDRRGKDIENIRVVNIGNVQTNPDIIQKEVNLLDWLTRLPSLYAPSKRHTMSFQLDTMLRANDINKGRNYYDFKIVMDEQDFEKLYMQTPRLNKL